MKYIVNRTCFFGNRLYEQGEAVEFGSAAGIPEWFTPLEKEPEHEPPEKEPETVKRPAAGGKTKSKE